MLMDPQSPEESAIGAAQMLTLLAFDVFPTFPTCSIPTPTLGHTAFCTCQGNAPLPAVHFPHDRAITEDGRLVG